MNISDFQSEFDKIMSRTYFSKEVHPQRKRAFSQLLEVGLPTKKWEDWRYTDLSIIANNSFRLSDTQDLPSKKIDISNYQIDGADPIVIFNGHYQEINHLQLKNLKYLNQNFLPIHLVQHHLFQQIRCLLALYLLLDF